MKNILLGLFIALFAVSCSNSESENTTVPASVENYVPVEYNGENHPDWSKNANIYELNIRQFSEKGDFNSILSHLPRLQKMGVDIIWLMPIQPIGKQNRKGSLGSYYSIKDYTDVNPEYGTKEDFKVLVDSMHQLGFKVVLDWVANHSAWDNPWAAAHPDWYDQDSTGTFVSPYDWTDVISLNYANTAMRTEMISSMKYWITDFDVDGFRCDVAMEVPTDFWNEARLSLDSLKPVFMLAEAEDPTHHAHAFDMSYAWEFHHISKEVAQGKQPLSAIDTILAKENGRFKNGDYRMMFTTNHDENSWNGTSEERYGANLGVSNVLMFTVYGMPLIYSGQESGLDHQMRFFEKDTIQWGNFQYQDFYTTLLALKHRNQSLWNGQYGGAAVKINTNLPAQVYAFSRTKDTDEIVVVLNYGEATLVQLQNNPTGAYRNVFTDEIIQLEASQRFDMEAFGYLVLEKV
tara:strand:- start:2243 stop:3625 length:1383 start_codon:yes stop_codon:yes gene_type:complete